MIEIQRRRAIDVLRLCAHPAGLKASAGAVGHHQIWARDSMIALLGARTVDDPHIQAALLHSLTALRRHQTPTGAIPNHIDLATGRPNFRAYADGGLWYVIGSALLDPHLPSIRRVLRWYECQDVDGTHLLSIQEASDWQDLFCTRGKGLYVNCLYVLALRKAAEVARSAGQPRLAARYRDRAAAVSQAVNDRLWYPGDGQMLRHVAHTFSTPNPSADSLGRQRYAPPKRILVDTPYYLAYLGFREVGEWFDSLGNLLAILAGVADAAQTRAILDFFPAHNLTRHPLPAIHPPVQPGDPDWRPYYVDINRPNHYHNGGLWPFIGGFYVVALVQSGRGKEAREALGNLAELNQTGDFPEWLEATTQSARGVTQQAWSAGMYLYAQACVASGSDL